MNFYSRREFLTGAAAATLAGTGMLLTGCGAKPAATNGPAVITGNSFQWRLVTTWPPHFPVLGEGAELFADWVDKMSAGRLKIQVYGGDELVPSLQAFDAVSQGAAEMGHGASYYWAGKAAATQFFASVPFGMNAQQMNAWLYSGDGLKLWEEIYANFNLIPFPVGNSGVQMGGWFNREINAVADLKGLKMRIPGLGGKVIAMAGASAVLSAGGEIFTNLERGVIDATEWVGPYHDYQMGFHKIAKYYYYPGWHEPGSVIELFVNRGAFEKLPADLKEIVRAAAFRSNMWMLAEFEAKNNLYLQKLLVEEKVMIKPFPAAIIATFKKYAHEVIANITDADAASKKVYASYLKFQTSATQWSELSERAYYNVLSAT